MPRRLTHLGLPKARASAAVVDPLAQARASTKSLPCLSLLQRRPMFFSAKERKRNQKNKKERHGKRRKEKKKKVKVKVSNLTWALTLLTGPMPPSPIVPTSRPNLLWTLPRPSPIAHCTRHIQSYSPIL